MRRAVQIAPADTLRPARRLRAPLSALAAGATALALLAVPPAHAADAPPPSGMPEAVPPAAIAPEPALPSADGWDFSEQFPRTSGTSRLDDGALLWADWLYDDTGAGIYRYDDPRAASNGADIFRAAVAADDTATHWRVDWNTLVDADVPVAAWTFDTDGDLATGTTQWPGDAGASSPGIDAALVVSSRGAWLHDAAGNSTDVTALGGTVTVDLEARSFVVSIPRHALAVDGTWTVRLAAGVADADGTGFAPAPGTTADATRVYNAAFRDLADEPHLVGGSVDASTQWNNGRQTERLATGDMSDFAVEVDWAELLSGVTTPEAQPAGYSTRWFVSSVEIGQGMAEGARRSPGPQVQPATFLGRVQPYTVYVPSDYSPGTPAPLTLLLHGGDSNHNGFLGARQDDVYQPMCEDRGSICVTPLGRGLSQWYINHSELDVWEVWNRVASAFTLDPDRTTVSGFSMGGVGATRFATTHPDVFAAAVIVSGAGYYTSGEVRDREGSELRTENLASVRTYLESGSRDIALPNTERWDRAAEAAGIPYRAHYYEGADHGMLGSWLGWSDAAEYLEQTAPRRVDDPATVTFRWEPGDHRDDLGMPVDRAYWLTGLDPRDDTARWSRVAATSLALQSTLFEPQLRDTVEVIDGREVRVRDQQLVKTGSAAAQNAVELEATNVGALTVDLDRAGLDAGAPGRVLLDTDGEVTVRLLRAGAAEPLTLPAGAHTVSSPDAPAGVTAFTAGATLHVRWAASASPLPVTYTVTDGAGRTLCETTDLRCLVVDRTRDWPAQIVVTAANIVGSSEGDATRVTARSAR